MRFIFPIILIGIAIAGFFTFTNPFYKDMSVLKTQIASYNDALSNSTILESEKEKLTQKYNSFNPDNLDKLSKLLPDNIDNIRLILEIEKLATPYGMVLKNVQYDTTDVAPVSTNTIQNNAAQVPKDYGIWNLGFSTQGTYDNFINFVKDLEKNLRIVDIVSVDFSPNITVGNNPLLSSIYQYTFKIKTYWLKN